MTTLSHSPTHSLVRIFCTSKIPKMRKTRIAVIFNKTNPKDDKVRNPIRTASYFSASFPRCIPKRETNRYNTNSKKAAKSRLFRPHSNNRPGFSILSEIFSVAEIISKLWNHQQSNGLGCRYMRKNTWLIPPRAALLVLYCDGQCITIHLPWNN